ncbi:response regulator [Undibacterium oligocarboniphilum]|uniref:Chemotaxis protein CheA n=2 Tax=Undibacterium oligocarboniphilum TaxID=666702 RepID=A0A850QD77_9BURK|nr:response regulator [Undibacterium oligocarboniphilum]NVO77531.1 response regulator [Undibacterium oligocarboniphilum]
MVGLTVFGEAGWNIEQVMNLWLSESRRGDQNLYALLEYTAKEMVIWVDELKQYGYSARTGADIIAAAERVKAGLDFEMPQAILMPPEMPGNLSAETATAPVSQLELESGGAATETIIATTPEGVSFETLLQEAELLPEFAEPTPAASVTMDEVLNAPDMPETASAANTEHFELSVFDDLPSAASLLAEPAAPTVAGVADVAPAMVATLPIAADELLHMPLENATMQPAEIPQEIAPPAELEAQETADSVAAGLASDTHQPDTSAADTGNSIAEETTSVSGAKIIGFPDLSKTVAPVDDNIKRIGDLEISVPLYSIYMAETDEIVRFLTQDFAEWRHEPHRHVSIHAIHASHSLAGSSATVGLKPLHELAHSLELVLQRLERHPVSLENAEFDVLDHALETARHMLQKFALSEMAETAPDEVRQLEQLLQNVIARSTAGADEEFVTSTNEKLDLSDLSGLPGHDAITSANLAAADLSATVLPVSTESLPDQSVQIKDELDYDLLPVFLEEGHDLLPMVGQLLRSWQEQPADTAIPQSIARLMHTIKGSARMAGAMGLGQHIHDMETRIESLMHTGHLVRQPLMDDLLARHDHSMQLFEYLQHPEAASVPVVPQVLTAAQELDQFQDAQVASEVQAQHVPATEAADSQMVSLTPLMPVAVNTPATRTSAPATQVSLPAAPGAPVPLVRVRADVLDRLVNQAGEVSISRSRLENEVGTLRASLGELTENVSRLRDQLREVEIQAETQITSRMAHSADREFDPLEFDRFTRLQELTRMMAESVSDVATVQTNLTRTIDGASGNLHIQARLTRELQQDLMRVRMIPFASVSERLYRVTRQTAKELDKRVNLDIRGAGVEMDRGVLEKMVGPFEHLLRNAIVHGIEARDVRRQLGKNETGELLIEIRQEGNEVVIRFNDDGRGLDLAHIRQKALSRGMISNEQAPNDAETASLIFEPGFSTATEITELAGRGVGMDVVRSEAASLGGRVEVSTIAGQGAEFTIHLPLTLAVTQVVLLNAGGRTLAVPSVLVEQVQHLKANALANAYNDSAVMWQGQRVSMYYLSTILGQNDAVPLAQQYTPLLVMKSGTERVAIHVDEIIGNREVVVKNIGPQLARMAGIAGATVLGSGEIVLILNPVPLAQRLEHERARLPQSGSETLPEMGAVADLQADAASTRNRSEPVQGLRTQHTVMVVDDSLTVRRVTQRLLTREGYQVVLAKDGIDALEQLQSVTPHVMLVDIEMPRMDGFDLTRNVRNDARTSHIPIIMITSRTADKHRNYAKELGVNEYFGKPYREDDLLEAITGLIGKEHTVLV